MNLVPDTALILLALLLCGHLLGDFVFQTRRMVEGKRERWGPLWEHAGEITLVQAAVLLPFFPDPDLVPLLVLVAVSHLLIDRLKVVLDRAAPRPVSWFVLDQGLHLAVLVVLAALTGPYLNPSIGPSAGVAVCRGAALVGVLAFNVNGGSALVSGLLTQLRARDGAEASDPVPAGRLIGILERLVVVLAVWQAAWAAVGLVVAAKSIARFEELRDRAFAEVYLVGTLASVLVAIASGLVLQRLVP